MAAQIDGMGIVAGSQRPNGGRAGESDRLSLDGAVLTVLRTSDLDREIADEREEAISGVGRETRQLHEAFSEVAGLVKEQRPGIENIAERTAGTRGHIEAGYACATLAGL